jgi:hypothetical protein
MLGGGCPIRSNEAVIGCGHASNKHRHASSVGGRGGRQQCPAQARRRTLRAGPAASVAKQRALAKHRHSPRGPRIHHWWLSARGRLPQRTQPRLELPPSVQAARIGGRSFHDDWLRHLAKQPVFARRSESAGYGSHRRRPAISRPRIIRTTRVMRAQAMRLGVRLPCPAKTISPPQVA